MDVSGLKSLLAKYVNEQVTSAIAAEYAKGRRLYIGTTNLDANRPVLWDITAIAASGQPSALELIRKVMLASASIPVVFPPVYFQVEYEGSTYDELHVDGGTAQQVFVYPAAIDWSKIMDKLGVPPDTSKAYVIRNASTNPKWEPIKSATILPIAGRSIGSLIRAQGIGDLNQIYLLCQRDQIEFNLAQIPSTFDKTENELFDREYMQALYEVGYNLAKNGYPWQKHPPYYAVPEETGAPESEQ